MGSRMKLRGPWDILVACALGLIYAPVLNPAGTFAGMDFLNLLFPHAMIVRSSWFSGHVPLWNWYEWSGAPLLAEMLSAAWYPPMLASLSLPLPFGLQVFVLLHLLWGAIGVWRLARLAGASPAAASFAAIAYAGSAFQLGHIEQTSPIAAMSWVPWIFDATARLAGAPHLRAGTLLWLAFAVAMGWLSGHPQSLLLGLIFAAFFSALLLLADVRAHRLSLRAGLQNTTLLLLAIAAGTAAASAQLIPTFELSGLSERVWPYPDPNSPALTWRYLPTILWPRYFSTLIGTPWQPLQYGELDMYCGIVTFALFLMGLFCTYRKRRSMLLALVATWLVSLLFALGTQGGVTWLVFRLVPFLQHSRGAARALNVETLCYCLIAAVGLTRLQVWSARHHPRLHGGVAALAIVILIIDLAWTHSHELTIRLVERVAIETERIPKLSNTNGSRVYRFMAYDSDYYLDNSRAAVVERVARLQPATNILVGTSFVDGYEQGLLPTRHYANFLRRYNRNLRNGRGLDPALLALVRCSTVFTEYPPEDFASNWKYVRTAPSPAGRDYLVWQSEYAGTSSWLLDESVFKPPTGFAPNDVVFYNPGTEIAVHDQAGLTSCTFAKATASAAATLVAQTPNALEFRAERPGGASDLVFLQAWYPGWKLRLPGTKTIELTSLSPVSSRVPVRGNGAAAQRFQLVFEPYSYRLGLFVSLLCLTGFVFTIVSIRKRSLTR